MASASPSPSREVEPGDVEAAAGGQTRQDRPQHILYPLRLHRLRRVSGLHMWGALSGPANHGGGGGA